MNDIIKYYKIYYFSDRFLKNLFSIDLRVYLMIITFKKVAIFKVEEALLILQTKPAIDLKELTSHFNRHNNQSKIVFYIKFLSNPWLT